MMMPERILARLQALCSDTPALERLVLFGSRAKGTHKYNSDIDLAAYWNGKPPADFHSRVDDAVELYSFDLVDANAVANPLLREEIEKYGVVLYEKERQEE